MSSTAPPRKRRKPQKILPKASAAHQPPPLPPPVPAVATTTLLPPTPVSAPSWYTVNPPPTAEEIQQFNLWRAAQIAMKRAQDAVLGVGSATSRITPEPLIQPSPIPISQPQRNGVTLTSANNIPRRDTVSTEEAEESEDKRSGSSPKTPKKQAYTREYKLSALNHLRNGRVEKKNKNGNVEMIPVSKRRCAKDFGVGPNQIREWIEQEERLLKAPPGSKAIGSGSPAHWPKMEDRLHALFLQERSRNPPRKLTRSWLSENAKRIFAEEYPNNTWIDEQGVQCYSLKFSQGWFQGFKERKGISREIEDGRGAGSGGGAAARGT